MSKAQEQQERLENINLYLKPGFQLSIVELVDQTYLVAWTNGEYYDEWTDEMDDGQDNGNIEIVAVDGYHEDTIDSYLDALEYMITNRANKPFKS